jgi:hypothetical protein
MQACGTKTSIEANPFKSQFLTHLWDSILLPGDDAEDIDVEASFRECELAQDSKFVLSSIQRTASLTMDLVSVINEKLALVANNLASNWKALRIVAMVLDSTCLRRYKKQPQKTKRQAKTNPPPAQVYYFCSLSCSLSCACHRYMNVTGQTLLEKKKPNHRIFPCGGFHTCCVCRVLILLSTQFISP